jgi:hypothetical protein
MPSIASQLRADRQRRDRRRQVLRGLLVTALVIALGVEVVSGSPDDASGATPVGMVQTTVAATGPTPTDLDPGLVRAFERARGDAARAGHELTINSGFRTASEQQALLARETVKRGSLAAAIVWVFPPDRSMHVQGLAIDVGDGPAADWLAASGARFGLCRTLDWEWWHFEWRARWEAAGTCPAPAGSPAEAPGI